MFLPPSPPVISTLLWLESKPQKDPSSGACEGFMIDPTVQMNQWNFWYRLQKFTSKQRHNKLHFGGQFILIWNVLCIVFNLAGVLTARHFLSSGQPWLQVFHRTMENND